MSVRGSVKGTPGGGDSRGPSSRGKTGGSRSSKDKAPEWTVKMIEPNKTLKSGKQRMAFLNGDIWEGAQQLPGVYLPSGAGHYTVACTGTLYKGVFEEGLLVGDGEVIYANGDRLVGSWSVEGCEGTLVYAEGTAYSGWLSRGQRTGYGVCEYSTGVRYEGCWKADMRKGDGIVMFPNGDKIEGVWEENMVLSGSGRRTSNRMDVYTGDMYTKASGSSLLKHSSPKGDSKPAGHSPGEIDFEVVRHGKGTVRGVPFPASDRECKYNNGDVYQGDWVEGLPEGVGIITYRDGTYFEGEWKGGVRGVGTGLIRSADWEYKGGLKNAEREGRGVCTWSDGSEYDGEWKADVRSGKGVLRKDDGSFYKGMWYEDIRQGMGAEIFSDRSEYEGEFLKDKPHGKGRIKYSDARQFEGDFVKSVPEGVGTLTFPWGDVYYGHVSEGKAHGTGKLTCINGDFQSGRFKDGITDGVVEGRRTLADGSIYTGQLLEWMPHGMGTMKREDGTSQTGLFQDGVLEKAGTHPTAGAPSLRARSGSGHSAAAHLPKPHALEAPPVEGDGGPPRVHLPPINLKALPGR